MAEFGSNRRWRNEAGGVIQLRWIVSIVVVIALAVPMACAALPDTSGTPMAELERHGAAGMTEDRDLDRPNVFLLFTDDQRFDTLSTMPNVRRYLMDEGVTFTNASVVNPLCCPSRASMLTGQYSHNTGVWTNHPPMGGAEAFDPSSTIATWLQDARYHTLFVGKYLNGYGNPGAHGRPPGWDRFAPIVDKTGFGFYRGYELSIDGQRRRYGMRQRDHSTLALPRLTRGFIHRSITTHPDEPFFAMLGLPASHFPFTPLRRDAKAFSDLPPWRPPSFGVVDREGIAAIDRVRLQQLRTLAGVDREVGRLVEWLDRIGEMDNTMFILTSDNGYMWGEHGFEGKIWPYEESIRVPMVIRFDPLTKGLARSDDRPVLNIDLAPTIADIAGIEPPAPVDGDSLLPLLAGRDTAWRKRSVIEYADGLGGRFDYCGIREDRWKLVEYESGAMELFDLVEDPWEMGNAVDDPRSVRILDQLLPVLRRLCRGHPTVSVPELKVV